MLGLPWLNSTTCLRAAWGDSARDSLLETPSTGTMAICVPPYLAVPES